MADLPSGRIPSGIGGVSQFEPPRNQVIQRKPSVWAEAGPKFAEILLANMLKQYSDSSKVQQAALAAGYEAVPEGQTPDPNRQVRQIGGKSYYAPMQSVYGVGPEGTHQNLGQVPEGAKVEQLKQPQQPKDVTFWRGPKGDTVQLPKNDPRGGQLLQAGYLPFNIYKQQQEMNRAGQPTPSEQGQAAKAAFIQEHGREPDAKEWNDILQQTHHPELTPSGGNFTPDETAYAQKLVAGLAPWPTGRMANDPLYKHAVEAAGQLDPGFNANTYKTRYDTNRAYTSGSQSKNIIGINTLTKHLDSLEKSAAGLENRDWPKWNTVANLLETETGDPRIAKFNMDLDAVSSELAAVFKAGAGAASPTQEEIKEWRKNINSSQSPAQLKAAIDEGYHLMFKRLGTLREQYDSAMGPFGTMQFLQPEARSLLVKKFGEAEIGALDPSPQARQGAGGGATPQPGQPGQRSPNSVLQSGW